MSFLAIGVDGTKHGWVAAAIGPDGFRGARVLERLDLVIDARPEASIFAVDIPIGLPEKSRRRADQLARDKLGASRSCVFWTPPRKAIEAPTHAEATRRSAKLTGHGVSAQSYALCIKIRETDQLVRSTKRRLIEVHPEVCFATLNGGRPLQWPKRTWNGQMTRRALLARAGLVLPEQLDDAGAAPADDVLDAVAAAWTGSRALRGEARSLPDPPDRDALGVEMAIWY